MPPTESTRARWDDETRQYVEHLEFEVGQLARQVAPKRELRSELARLLGVDHLKGERQLRGAVARVNELLLVEGLANFGRSDES